MGHHASNAVHVALEYAGRVVAATLVQLALVLGSALLIAAVMQPVALQSERWTTRLVGPRARWVAVGWIATALHELGHALFALLFGHRVTRVKWFDFRAEDGTRGQVEHDYDPASLYQRVGRFFIGVGPIVVASLLLALAARLLLGAHTPPPGGGSLAAKGGAALEVSSRALIAQLVAQLGVALQALRHLASALRPGRWTTWGFLYVAYVAGSAMRLSGSDVRSAAAGMWTVGCLLVLVNALTLWAAGAVATSLALGAARGLALCGAALLAAVALQAVVGAAALALAHAVEAVGARRRATVAASR